MSSSPKLIVFLLLFGLLFNGQAQSNKTQTTKPEAKKANAKPAVTKSKKSKVAKNVIEQDLKNKLNTAAKNNKPEVVFISRGNGTMLSNFGDELKLHLSVYNFKDSLLGTSYSSGRPISQVLVPGQYNGAFENGLTGIKEGDSLKVLVNSDSLYKFQGEQNRPKFIPKGTKLRYNVKVVGVTNLSKLKEENEKNLVDYAKTNSLDATKLPSGLRIAYKQKTEGLQAKAGDSVSVHYKGMLLNGTVFDESYPRGEPITFVLGTGRVIKGWDEGVAQLKVGEKAVFLIPSDLAYGARGAGGAIPPHSPLIFEVELVKVIPKKQ